MTDLQDDELGPDGDTDLDEGGASSSDVRPELYKESDDHVPNPLYMTGHVDTTGTAGDHAASVHQMSPVFQQAREAAFSAAVDAVENHPAGRPDSVVLPEGEKTYEQAHEDLIRARDEARQSLETGLTPAQQQAAEEGEPVNPNALIDDTHDFSVEGPTAPPTGNAQDIPVPDAVSSADTGVANVNPNPESVEQAEAGGVQPTVVAAAPERTAEHRAADADGSDDLE